MSAVLFVVRATVSDSTKRPAFDAWYSREHLPDAVKSFGAVKAWTAYAIASNEIASRHRIDLDATIQALAQTAKDMNSKYKETSEAGLALSVVLC